MEVLLFVVLTSSATWTTEYAKLRSNYIVFFFLILEKSFIVIYILALFPAHLYDHLPQRGLSWHLPAGSLMPHRLLASRFKKMLRTNIDLENCFFY